jgi:hypothetical protein
MSSGNIQTADQSFENPFTGNHAIDDEYAPISIHRGHFEMIATASGARKSEGRIKRFLVHDASANQNELVPMDYRTEKDRNSPNIVHLRVGFVHYSIVGGFSSKNIAQIHAN